MSNETSMLGFLFYDLILIGPLLARLPVVKPEDVLGLVVALIIIVYSAALGIRYLFLTRAF